jgi:hypothetical protein
MLITAGDFIGEYRLFNANNLDPDVLAAIDSAQAELARDLFPVGAGFIINNLPINPPNIGLRNLGLHQLFVPWVFLRLELGVAGAGIKRVSDVPGRSKFASGAFFAVGRQYRYFLAEWLPWEGHISGVVTNPTNIAVSPLAGQILTSGMEIELNGAKYLIVGYTAPDIIISPSLPASLTGTVRFRQVSLRVERKWVYF